MPIGSSGDKKKGKEKKKRISTKEGAHTHSHIQEKQTKIKRGKKSRDRYVEGKDWDRYYII